MQKVIRENNLRFLGFFYKTDFKEDNYEQSIWIQQMEKPIRMTCKKGREGPDHYRPTPFKKCIEEMKLASAKNSFSSFSRRFSRSCAILCPFPTLVILLLFRELEVSTFLCHIKYRLHRFLRHAKTLRFLHGQGDTLPFLIHLHHPHGDHVPHAEQLGGVFYPAGQL